MSTHTTLHDAFWQQYQTLVKDKMIPYQWSVINDEADVKIETENDHTPIAAIEKSHAVQNFKIAAGQAEGDFYGFWFQDSDVYKWLEAVAYALRYAPDDKLQATADNLINLIAAAQQPDGYLDTYFIIRAPERKFQHVSESHELYCMGHYIEAGIAYHNTTGNRQALDIAIKMADCINANFGPEEGKLHGFPGHPELELALAKLADQTSNDQYSKLAKYMLDQRGQQKHNFFATQHANSKDKAESYWPGGEPDAAYLQNRVPVRELKSAEGHAVRMVYLLTGMALVAQQTGDDSLLQAAKDLWTDITDRQMYVTGGVGATPDGEAFTFDYDLPNDTMYCETCASVAMAFFAKQLLQAEPNGKYADVLERELYNGTISGMALDGEHFFYVNPLSVNPEASAKDPHKSHVKVTRPSWFGCACCPPNLARLVASVDQYVYTEKNDVIYSNLFIGNDTTFANGVKISQRSNYPWEGTINYTISAAKPTTAKIAIRIPAWSHHTSAMIDGKATPLTTTNGYWFLDQALTDQPLHVSLTLDMTPQRLTADPRVTADLGKVALQRGPVVYCLEQADNGAHLPWLTLPQDAALIAQQDTTRFPVTVETITTTGTKLSPSSTDLYATGKQSTPLTFVPYFAWANRGAGEMTVWVNAE